MKTLFISLLVLSIGFNQSVMSQDIDLFNKHLNDNFDMPSVHKDMTFKEYQLLSRDLRMKQMLYGMVVPGYVHFYAHENTLGYSMLGTRLVGYGGLAYVLAKNEDILSLSSLVKLQFDKAVFPEGEENKYTAITTVSVIMIFGSYLFDWIHGQYLLKRKQEEIRFKYSPKLTFGLTQNMYDTGMIPTAGLSMRF